MRLFYQLVALERDGLIGALFARLVTLLHIFALLNGGDGGGVGAGTAYAEFLQLADKACLVVADGAL